MTRKQSILNTCNNPNHILYEDCDAVEQISVNLLSHIPINAPESIIIVCIGTDRSTGDSLGPLVGTFLSEKMNSSFSVYGTLDDPIHAVNLEEKLNDIHAKHKNSFIIAVDACLGRMKSIGAVQILPGPLKPGAGVNKNLPEVGDMHITGIVNVSGFMEFFVLQNTRLNLVLKMAKTIADSIDLAGQSLLSYQKASNIEWEFEQEKAT